MIYIKDEEFVRGDCPMTKEEIRILSIAKMELRENYRVLDVGAGTGSVSIQASKCCSKGNVVAIEKDEAALQTIYKNIEKFSVNNLKVIEKSAMEVLPNLTEGFHSIFVGGSSGELKDIIEQCHRLLMAEGTIVLNFITLNNVYTAMETLKALGYKIECSQIGVSKTRGQSYMLTALNPIFIVKAKKTK